MKRINGYEIADEGNIFVCTEYGYQRSLQLKIKGREIGKPIPGIYPPNKVPALWVVKGYVQEVREAIDG